MNGFVAAGLSGCMRDWLKMSGAATSDLDRLEEKTRSFHLSEGQILHVYPAPVLRALLPVSVATKLKTCVGKAKCMRMLRAINQNGHFTENILFVGYVFLFLDLVCRAGDCVHVTCMQSPGLALRRKATFVSAIKLFTDSQCHSFA